MNSLDAVIGMAIWRYIQVDTHVSLMNVYKAGSYEVLYQHNDAILSRSRARLVWRFLTDNQFDDADTLVFIDADMIFSEQALTDLIGFSRQQKAVVGAACTTRGQGKLNLSLNEGQTIELGPDTKYQRVRSIGTGFMAIPRQVLEKMTKALPFIEKNQEWPFWPMFEPIIRKGEFFAEDTSFCFRAKEAGTQIYAMTHHQVGHIGEHTFLPNQGRYP